VVRLSLHLGGILFAFMVQENIKSLIQAIDITDKVAKESSDSNASSHKLHDEDSSATSGGSLHANAHKANPVRP
jgi:hypothetical protein